MVKNAEKRSAETRLRHYKNRARFLLWRWHLTLRGVKYIIAEVRLLKYLRRKHLQSKEIDFTELN
jgi:hypothetical protein